YLIGMIAIVIMRRYFKDKLYLYRIWALIKLNLIFFRELLLSNIDVLKILLRPKMDIKSSVFAYQTKVEHHLELMLLSNLNTLTPHTLVLNVSDDQLTLYIHAIDVEDVNEEIDSIKNSFEKAIKEVEFS